jgi:hypothetical protein
MRLELPSGCRAASRRYIAEIEKQAALQGCYKDVFSSFEASLRSAPQDEGRALDGIKKNPHPEARPPGSSPVGASKDARTAVQPRASQKLRQLARDSCFS